MKLQISRSWDFNQMLVASVFAHLLLMTFVIFIPKSTYEEIVITPAFVVELVDINKSKKKSAKKPLDKKKTQEKPVPEPEKAPDPVLEKPIVPPKITEPSPSSLPMPPKPIAKKPDILKQLNQLDKKSPKVLVQELDQLAKLVPTVPPKKPEVKKTAPILEQTFDELNALKNKKMEFAPTPTELAPVENPLDQFENLKMKEELEVEPLTPETPENNIQSSLKELEFASLTPNTVELQKKQDEKSPTDLLQELTKIESQDSEVRKPEDSQKKDVVDPDQKKDSQGFESILKKFESLEKIKPKEINTDTVVAKSLTQDFQSDIRKVSVPEQVEVEVVASASPDGFPAPLDGNPSADVLAKYVGMIKAKVLENWREPLGENYNREVVCSFFIYPKGNIDHPEFKTSSNIELLDNLARRAILESRPFPPFPEEIKSSNLNISIHFKYIPEKNK